MMQFDDRESGDPQRPTEENGSVGETAPGGAPPPRILTIVNKRGLHARASARFVQTAEGFDAEITVARDGLSVGGQSIMGLMMLAASQGTEIEVSATGEDAKAALDAIEALIASRFGEES